VTSAAQCELCIIIGIHSASSYEDDLLPFLILFFNILWLYCIFIVGNMYGTLTHDCDVDGTRLDGVHCSIADTLTFGNRDVSPEVGMFED
jgi:hypothetical protein